MADNSLECVDILTKCGMGITVWSISLPDDDVLTNDGPVPFLDIVYPVRIPSVAVAILFAKAKLGDFEVLSAG